MIQHVRRKLASVLPAPEISIPLLSVLQTAVVGVFMLKLRFSSVLVAAVTVAATVRTEPLPSEVLIAMTAAAWSDGSAVSYLKVRRAG
ncbi:hypothetical protein [Streptomyces sp. Ru87]|uniref:hypothetical protein n=1 Tax=Streptomyces sp. Ru87 TaxID=2044307 RepID=UPI000BF8D3B3|nr:hypothetical protein [Streptomyces sp. Ru87]PGH46945.1 hypothetical protein CRI70_31360 [Streptomyces sp. Ru87]